MSEHQVGDTVFISLSERREHDYDHLGLKSVYWRPAVITAITDESSTKVVVALYEGPDEYHDRPYIWTHRVPSSSVHPPEDHTLVLRQDLRDGMEVNGVPIRNVQHQAEFTTWDEGGRAEYMAKDTIIVATESIEPIWLPLIQARSNAKYPTFNYELAQRELHE